LSYYGVQIGKRHKKTNSIGQRGPTTFDLRAILQKRDNLWVASNKNMYKTTDSQHLKLKTEDRLVGH